MLTSGPPTDLSTVTAPTLLLWRKDAPGAGNAQGGPLEMATELPNALYVEIPGTDVAPYSGDVDELVAEIRRFITGDAGEVAVGDREITVVVFSDIVESTVTASRMGDTAWRGTLDVHDAITREVVTRSGGRIVKQTGDGILAEFRLASRAITAARELRERLRGIGVSIRIGVHVGEVERRDDDISGVAVHVAARLMSLAEPGEIVASGSVPLVIGNAGTSLVPGHAVELKGLPGQWLTFTVPE